MHNKIMPLILGLLIGIVGTLFFTRNPIISNNVNVARMMDVNRLDRHFIEQMIPHHEGAIEMAELAKKRSQRKEILSLAEAIIESQSVEIIQMKDWYKDWFGTDVPKNFDVEMGMGRGMMHGGMMGGNTSDIEALKNADNFDKAFLEEMIPHHQMAVMMAEMLLSGTNRQEMKLLAKDIIEAQESEIEQMRLWLRE